MNCLTILSDNLTARCVRSFPYKTFIVEDMLGKTRLYRVVLQKIIVKNGGLYMARVFSVEIKQIKQKRLNVSSDETKYHHSVHLHEKRTMLLNYWNLYSRSTQLRSIYERVGIISNANMQARKMDYLVTMIQNYS